MVVYLYLFDFLQCAGDGVDDEPADGDIFRDERVRLNGLDGHIRLW